MQKTCIDTTSSIVSPANSTVRLTRSMTSFNVTCAREPRDVVGSAKRQCLNGHGGLAPSGGDEAAAIAQEEIPDVMSSMIAVNH